MNGLTQGGSWLCCGCGCDLIVCWAYRSHSVPQPCITRCIPHYVYHYSRVGGGKGAALLLRRLAQRETDLLVPAPSQHCSSTPPWKTVQPFFSFFVRTQAYTRNLLLCVRRCRRVFSGSDPARSVSYFYSYYVLRYNYAHTLKYWEEEEK